jgi:hypothetical protein
VYLNWTSLTSRKYKISLIYCLCNRIWRICQDKDERDLEFKKLKVILAKNEYPDKIINTEIDKFVKNRERIESVLAAAQDENNNDVFVPTSESEQVSQATTKPKEKKQKKYIVLPYSNRKADDFAKGLKQLVENNFEVEAKRL